MNKKPLAITLILIAFLVFYTFIPGMASESSQMYFPVVQMRNYSRPTIIYVPKIIVTNVWIADLANSTTGVVHRGETINLWIEYDSAFLAQSIFTWQIIGPCGEIYKYDRNVQLLRGRFQKYQSVYIYSNVCLGDYTFYFESDLIGRGIPYGETSFTIVE